MRIPSGMISSHNFARVPSVNIPRSVFNRSHGYKTTFNEGMLIPFYWDEALPGDTFNLNLTAFARMATPLFPIMDNLYFDTFFFAVPYRLVWDNWEKFNGAQDNPGDSTAFVTPKCTSPVGGYTELSLHDYLGLPTKIVGLVHNNFVPRAYNLIWNEWFRDQNLQNSVVVNKGNGPDTPADYVLLRRGKRHDYFTSCLPWPQKGPIVSLPLGTSAPVVSTNTAFSMKTGSVDNTIISSDGTNMRRGTGVNWNVSQDFVWGAATGLQTDLSTATAATINDLRQAFQYQRMYERDARGGTRYQEMIYSHFKVMGADSRLQRPEYLGGSSTPINITPVAQTSSTSGTAALGDLAAFATMAAHGQHGFTKSFTEHCIIIGICSVRADLNYQQGLNRSWSRNTRFDYFWPTLQHLGEQAVLNKEIYAQGTGADNNVFGYQQRYGEYKYKPSQITGAFRSNFTGTLDAWHLAQNFGSLPTLGNTFIGENAPMTRIKATNTDPDFIMDCFVSLKCARPMAVDAVPGLIDHF
jgi:hypothetical protein